MGRTPPDQDENRMIAIVTGANSGFGLGICHLLLSSLSLPLSTPIPLSQPQPTALPAGLSCTASSSVSSAKTVPSSPPPTLTLILACRSGQKASEAISLVLKKHYKELEQRRKAGVPVREGWKEGLKLVWEKVDLDSVGGKNGVLTFCERIRSTYPHITTLFLNAGYGAFSGTAYWTFIKQIFTEGLSRATSHPKHDIQIMGVKSSDGERGKVWGTNVFAAYLMVCLILDFPPVLTGILQIKELYPLLLRSPPSLPFPPRIIYTGSLEAESHNLHPNPLDDYQLLSYGRSYAASKYMGELIAVQFDKTLSSPSSPLRVLIAEPGIVQTSIFAQGLGAWAWLRTINWWFAWTALYLARLLGSVHHPVYPEQGAMPILYSALVASQYLLPASKVPAPIFGARSSRWGKTTVKYGEVDQWEQMESVGEGLMERCEALRKDWRRREGLDV
ncbi:hypothetical protein P7C73_g3174, partial [Tremellales sp. Uapishka_1]